MIEENKKTLQLISSPCIRNCCLNDEEHCLGCFRSLDEIIHWGNANDTLRKRILENCERRRQAYAIKWHK